MDHLKTLLAEIAADPSASTSIFDPQCEQLVQLAQRLSETEDLACFNEHVHLLGTSGSSISYHELARSLVIRARETCAKTAIEDVAAYLQSETLALEYAFLLPGIRADADYEFTNGVRLVKFWNIQDSSVRDALSTQGQRFGTPDVTTLLVVSYDVPKYYFPNTEGGRPLAETPWPPHQELDDTRLILSLVRPCEYGIPLLASAVIIPKNLAFLDRGLSWSPHPEPLAHLSPEIIGIETTNADKRLRQFESLSDETKDRLRITMKRLNATKIDAESVNKYINMRVCLENLFLAEGETFGISGNLKNRIPRHSDLTENEARDYYSDMSTAVHTGRLPANPTTSIPKIIRLIKDRIVSVLETGAYPNW